MSMSIPLSHMQQGLLFHHLSGAPAGVDVEQIVAELAHAVDPEALEQAWQRVAVRHAALRTTFSWDGLDTPQQRIGSTLQISFRVEDWSDRDHAAGQFEALVAQERLLGFDLAQGPLHRIVLVRFAEAEHRMLWTFPHIVLDGRSFGLLLRELFAEYDAVVEGATSARPEAPSMETFLHWLAARDSSGDAAFWRALLEGFATPTALPGGGRDVEAEGRRLTAERRLPAEAKAALEQLAAAAGSSLNATVQAAWGLVLARHAGEQDVVFGATRSGRAGTVADAEAVAGVFINTLPVRVRFDDATTVAALLQSVRRQHVEVRPFEHTPLVDVQQASAVPGGTALFSSIVVFDRQTLNDELRAAGGAWLQRRFTLLERTSFPATLNVWAGPELAVRLSWDSDAIAPELGARLLDQLLVVLDAMAAGPDAKVADLPVLSAAERALLAAWNDTAVPVEARCVHELFAAQVTRTPDALAVAFRDRTMTFTELDAAANRLARHLIDLGVMPDARVGLCLPRSLELVIAVLAIHKAGGAYVPLDPEYPAERVRYMLEDSGARVLVTTAALVERMPGFAGATVLLDEQATTIAACEPTAPDIAVAPHHLAYAIYTSGSTGRPKGVLVEHRNVANFFVAMDDVLGDTPDGAFLALTSLSFDISVLELLWTLCRGRTVVVFDEARGAAGAAAQPRLHRQLAFSLFYFSSDDGGGGDRYRLLREGARFADENNFHAVWTPERHFHEFGGLFPNPSVTSAAIAAMTTRVGIRSGSVVLPLHHPVRVAEEWSVVDNLSNGRVGISVASGWQPNDFVLRPENHARRNDIMYESLEQVRALWRGESLQLAGPAGAVEVRTLPRPVQAELPVWITAAGSPETFRRAGHIGANILTHLLGQTVESLAGNIAIYREARRAAGHPGRGVVTLMLHTFVGTDQAAVKELVREPMKQYLRSAVSLVKNFSAEWTAYSKRAGRAVAAEGDEFSRLSAEDMDSLLDFAFERYFETSGLFGTPESCLAMTERLKAIGIDELGCLIDFGVDHDLVLQHLELLNRLRVLANQPPVVDDSDFSLPAQVARYGVNMMQCTPSLAAMLLGDAGSRPALGAMDRILVGGEAFPAGLARELRAATAAEVINMYGPTETTIWSGVHSVCTGDDPVPIGRPVANTTFHVLDDAGQPVPLGAAGELCIGGAGVVRGYHERPELTTSRFTTLPSGERAYRTGDLVRYRADGALLFIGRGDTQVKVRGHRIELGEIEAVIVEDPAVQQAVVVAHGTDSNQRLVAYLVAAEGAALQTAEVREHVRRRLPEFMVPSVFLTLKALPLTPNAKVDRRALPEPDAVEVERELPFVAPASELERTIAGIWQELLNVKSVGMRDNFFDLGGHSLLAVQLHGRLRRELGRDLPLTDLFRFPTVQSLAAHLGGTGPATSVVEAGADRADARRQSMQRRMQRRN